MSSQMSIVCLIEYVFAIGIAHSTSIHSFIHRSSFFSFEKTKMFFCNLKTFLNIININCILTDILMKIHLISYSSSKQFIHHYRFGRNMLFMSCQSNQIKI